jgi:hypothetical protein
MHEKYENSDKSKKITEILRNADAYTYIDRNKQKGALNDRFAQLSYSIHKTMIMADSETQLTDLSVCNMMEYVGRTMADQPNVVSYMNSLDIADKTFTDERYFKSMIFGFLYGLYIMHSRLKLIHGDLHMNNITLLRIGVFLPEPILLKYKCYIVGGKRYYHPTNGVIPCIIDFSRSIIGDAHAIEKRFSPAYTADFFEEQNARILKILYSHFNALTVSIGPTLIKKALRNNFEKMFNVLCGLDVYMMIRNIYHLCTDKDSMFKKRQLEIPESIVNWLYDFMHRCSEMFEKELTACVNGEPCSDKLMSERVMWESPPPESLEYLVDVFDADRTIDYVADDPSRWGPFMDGHDKARSEFDRAVEISTDVYKFAEKWKHKEKTVVEFEPWMTE